MPLRNCSTLRSGAQGPDGLAAGVEHPDQRESQVTGLRRLDINRWASDHAGLGEGKVGEVCVVSRSAGRLGHVQTQGFVRRHR